MRLLVPRGPVEEPADGVVTEVMKAEVRQSQALLVRADFSLFNRFSFGGRSNSVLATSKRF